jgi:hypothetical protein
VYRAAVDNKAPGDLIPALKANEKGTRMINKTIQSNPNKLYSCLATIIATNNPKKTTETYATGTKHMSHPTVLLGDRSHAFKLFCPRQNSLRINPPTVFTVPR